MEHGCHIAQWHWLQEEEVKSSTWRELRAVRQVLKTFAPKLRNERVRWFKDKTKMLPGLLPLAVKSLTCKLKRWQFSRLQ